MSIRNLLKGGLEHKAGLLLLLAVSILVFGSTLYGVFDHYHTIPLMDQWETTRLFEDYQKGSLTFGAFWAQHNEHRIPISRALILLDDIFDHGTGYFLIPLILLIQAFHTLLLIRVVRKSGGSAGRDWIFFSSIAFIISFWLIQRDNFMYSFQIVWVLNGFSISLAAFWVCTAGEDKSTHRWKPIGLAALACVVAAYSLANGLFMCGVLWVILWKVGRPRKYLFAWTFFSAILAASYLAHYHSPANHSSLSDGVHLQTLRYLLVYLGSPFAKFSLKVGEGFGLTGLILCFFFAWRFLRARRFSFFEAFVFSETTYILITAAVTAIGRTRFGLDQAVTSRYFTPVLIFWFFLLAQVYNLMKFESKVLRILRFSFLLFCLAFVLGFQLIGFLHMKKTYRELDEAALGLMVGVQDSSTGNRIYPGYARLWNENKLLMQNKLSVYHEPWTLAMGQKPSNIYALDSSVVLQGKVQKVRTLDVPAHSGYFVTGRIDPASGIKIPEVILFSNRDTVVGYAKTDKRPCPGCFSGYVMGLENGKFDVFGLDEKAKRIRKYPLPLNPDPVLSRAELLSPP